ncbi:MAG: TIGR01212 family radical SAM protein [Desulfovibrionales bacterium]
MNRYFSFSTYLRRRFGRRAQKIPLDGGFDCPNRDGSISRSGCIFCSPLGSGTGSGMQGSTIEEQWNLWRRKIRSRQGDALCLAYLQSFTNTYGPPDRLRHVLDTIIALPDLAGVCIGTRPDCLDPEKQDMIASLPVEEVWIELGLQSANDATLQRINRGHDVATFVKAVETLSTSGINVCVHVIAGLPGEGEDDLLRTVELVNALPVQGIKFHNLFVCRGSTLARWWKEGLYHPPSREEYVSWLVSGLTILRSDIVVQRLNADPRPGELLAPQWAVQKSDLIHTIRRKLDDENLWQGSAREESDHPPDWFSPPPHPCSKKETPS